MDTNKKIAKAMLNKNFVEAKELVFKSLYAKASLAMDEARYDVANSVFNEDKKMGMYSHDSEEDKKTEKKKGKNEKPSMYEATEQLDEVSPPDMEKMTGSKKTKASFAKQYGKRGKSVMYATAWKLHNKKAGKD